jgi:multiple antibiotic resistance protein
VEIQASSEEHALGIVPLGTPLIVGPAVLATLLLLIKQYSIPIVLAAFVLNLAFASLIFAQANRVANFLGPGD